MKKYTKIYLEAINEDTEDNTVFIPCECCGKKATEIHHILNKSRLIHHNILPLKDSIENIMGICRVCHIKYGEKNAEIPILFKRHLKHMRSRGVSLNEKRINHLITYYEITT